MSDDPDNSHERRDQGLHPDDVELLPDGGGFLLVESGADTKANSDDGWEDAAVPPDQVGAYRRDFRDLLDRFGYHASLYGHFGQGCIHCGIDFTLDTVHGIDQWRRFLDQAADLVISYGGSLSGEHGDGQARGAQLQKMYGAELLGAFAQFKEIWDPDGGMNPGKVVHLFQPDENLRQGPDASLRRVKTHFAFPMTTSISPTRRPVASASGLAATWARGRCAPVTWRPAKRKTRRGDGPGCSLRCCAATSSTDGETTAWRCRSTSASLARATTDCPVNVDMATYKAEFLSHYYSRRLRPRVAYSIGLIYWAARVASKAPRLVNVMTHAPVLSWLVKRAGGIAPERTIPRFATPTFTRWFDNRTPSVRTTPPRGPHDGAPIIDHSEIPRFIAEAYSTPSMQHNAGENRAHPHGSAAPFDTSRVLLWPDTFNTYLESSVLQAAVEVLEDAGYAIDIPPRPLCCGRPLYGFGMLDTAERLWRQTLRTLRPWTRAGIPNLFPHDDDARHLSDQTLLLLEFLERQRYQPPITQGLGATVHGHCHHKALIGMDAEVALLKRMGVDHDVIDSGCCGMAGSFGFAAENYEASMRVGERVLLPAVRARDGHELIITDGFSCREQIQQSTGRTPVHIAELLQRAIHNQDAEVDVAREPPVPPSITRWDAGLNRSWATIRPRGRHATGFRPKRRGRPTASSVGARRNR